MVDTRDIRLAWAPVGATSGTLDAPAVMADARRAASWGVLRTLVGDPAARIDNTCPRCGGPHGPVRLPDLPVRASITYAGGLALVAVVDARLADLLGLDAEPEHDERRDAAGMHGVLGGDGTASVRDWTRVEAALKADGRGLRVDPADVVISLSPAGPHAAGWTARVPGLRIALRGFDLAGPPGIVVSAAAAASAEARTPEGARGGQERRATP